MSDRPGHAALITGIAGFSGSHLAELLLSKGWAVAGLELPTAGTRNLGAVLGEVSLYRADLQDAAAVRQVLAEVRPAQVYHLAALIRPPAGADWRALYEANVYGTAHLLEAIMAGGLDCAVLIAGSAAQYGRAPATENPLQETAAFCPVTHYGISKVAQDLLGYRYWVAAGLRVVRTRAFNLMGPRQGPQLAGSAFAQQIAEIEVGRREPVVEVGDLTAQRDFVDVRDAARAYVLALDQGEPGAAYNVCSGRGCTIAEVLDGLLALSTVRGIAVRQDPARTLPAGVPVQVGDYTRLYERTGWRPQIPLTQTLRDLLDYWREEQR